MEKEIAGISPDVARELLQDMYFIATLFEIQSNVGDDNKWLKDYYSKIGIPYLSIVLHEWFQANLLDKKIQQGMECWRSMRKKHLRFV